MVRTMATPWISVEKNYANLRFLQCHGFFATPGHQLSETKWNLFAIDDNVKRQRANEPAVEGFRAATVPGACPKSL